MIKRFIVVSLLLITSVCKSVSSQDLQYKDGTYIGEDGFVIVEVIIKDGNIENIDILEHTGGGKKYEEMIAPLGNDILEAQSTDVDAISGATVSSEYFKNAVNNALQNAVLK